MRKRTRPGPSLMFWPAVVYRLIKSRLRVHLYTLEGAKLTVRGHANAKDESSKAGTWSPSCSVQVSSHSDLCLKTYHLTPSPGVHPHRDLRSGIWNFPSEFSQIPTPKEYAFDRSPKYITPSQDEVGHFLSTREMS